MPHHDGAPCADLSGVDTMQSEVQRLKGILLSGTTSPCRLLDALEALRCLGTVSKTLLRETDVGKVVRSISRDVLVAESVRSKASSLLESWRLKHRKRELSADASVGNGGQTPSQMQLRHKASSASTFLSAQARQEHFTSGAITGAPVHRTTVGSVRNNTERSTAAVNKACEVGRLLPHREKVRQKLVETLQTETKLLLSEGMDPVKLSAPVQAATAIEGALYTQLASQSERTYLNQCRSVIFNLKGGRSTLFRRKILTGSVKPESIPQMSAEDMANDSMQAERASVRKSALEAAMVRDPEGEFTCEMCRGSLCRRTLGEVR